MLFENNCLIIEKFSHRNKFSNRFLIKLDKVRHYSFEQSQRVFVSLTMAQVMDQVRVLHIS